MAHDCQLCERTFSTRFNLERHMERKHPDDITDDESSGEEEEQTDDESIHPDKDDTEERTESTFQELVARAWNQVKQNHQDLTHQEAVDKARKALRREYKDSLLWYQQLRKDPIHKAVMETAKRLRDDDDFDYEESIERAISSRKYLLNRLIPSDT